MQGKVRTMSIIPETIWHDLEPYLGKGFGEEAYIRKILFDNQKLQLDELKASNAKLRAACEVARHWLIVNDWLKLDETIELLEAALEAVKDESE